jgi:hypothetical protein
MADWTGLDRAFVWPEYLPEDLKALGEYILARTRAETEHLPLNTALQLLIERYITTYLIIKYREQVEVGTPVTEDQRIQGFLSSAESRSFNDFWVKLAKELFEMLHKEKAGDRDSIVAEVVTAFREAVIEGITDSIMDNSTRNEVKMAIVGAMERRGL